MKVNAMLLSLFEQPSLLLTRIRESGVCDNIATEFVRSFSKYNND